MSRNMCNLYQTVSFTDDPERNLWIISLWPTSQKYSRPVKFYSLAEKKFRIYAVIFRQIEGLLYDHDSWKFVMQCVIETPAGGPLNIHLWSVAYLGFSRRGRGDPVGLVDRSASRVHQRSPVRESEGTESPGSWSLSVN